eukprot:TRINITY_DN3658_c0_g1_i1.p1 TRINITY_DN3658_c0_g1~~TRINITY_DN3658_c0_g1_i1.p1  ORF type:complete len:412 (-),score=73.05 TRINITY_DN3658_c0_g1_i1:198-1433(-)
MSDFSLPKFVTRAFKVLKAFYGLLLFNLMHIPFFLKTLWFYYTDPCIIKAVKYGTKEHQVADIYTTTARDSTSSSSNSNSNSNSSNSNRNSSNSNGDGKPVVVFIHGGAWSSGGKLLYALLGKILREKGGCVTVIPKMGLYPKMLVRGMVDDVAAVLSYVKGNAHLYGVDPNRITLIGHSSGAHISALYLLKQALYQTQSNRDEVIDGHDSVLRRAIRSVEIKNFIGIAGPYCISDHYLHETYRGVELISPMKPCMGGLDDFHLHSPTRLAVSLPSLTDNHSKPTNGPVSSTPTLEKNGIRRRGADRMGSAVDLLGAHRSYVSASLPSFHLLHSKGDTTVPFTSSAKFAEEIQRHVGSSRVHLVDFDAVGPDPNQVFSHSDMIVAAMSPDVGAAKHDSLVQYVLGVVGGTT